MPDLVLDDGGGVEGAGSDSGLTEEAEPLLGGGAKGGEASQLLNGGVLRGNGRAEGGLLGHGEGELSGGGRDSEHVDLRSGSGDGAGGESGGTSESGGGASAGVPELAICGAGC